MLQTYYISRNFLWSALFWVIGKNAKRQRWTYIPTEDNRPAKDGRTHLQTDTVNCRNSFSGKRSIYFRNISCPLCSKTFFTDNTLKCHMISHYDVMYWSCRICSKNFKRLKNVKSHLKSLHGILDKEEVGQAYSLRFLYSEIYEIIYLLVRYALKSKFNINY